MKLKVFKQIYIYRLVIIRVLYFAIKYRIMAITLTDVKFLQIVGRGGAKNSQAIVSNHNTKQPKDAIIRLIERVLNSLMPNLSCLIRSLIKRDILKHYGYNEIINIGVRIINNEIDAHAWILSENKMNYTKLHQL